MQKGTRFIWYHWNKKAHAILHNTQGTYEFKGTVHAYGQLRKGIKLHRTIKKWKGVLHWEVIDTIEGITSINIGEPIQLNQYWHFDGNKKYKLTISAKDNQGNPLTPEHHKGWYSQYYGEKSPNDLINYCTVNNSITTTITC